MTQGSSTPEGQKFSGEDLAAALEGLPEDLTEGIMQKLGANAAEAEKTKQRKVLQFRLAELAIAAHQNGAEDVPSMLDVITWERCTSDTSHALLFDYGKADTELRGFVPRSAVDFAAYYFTAREIDRECDVSAVDSLINPIGYTQQSMYEGYLDLYVTNGSFGGKTREEIQIMFPTLYELSFYIQYEIFTPLEQTMRTDLKGLGFSLPELEPDNSYGYVEDQGYVMPRVEESMFPTA